MTENEIALALLRYPLPPGVYLHETLHQSLFRMYDSKGNPTHQFSFYLQDHHNPFQGGPYFGAIIPEEATREEIVSIVAGAAQAFLTLKNEHPVHEEADS